MISTRLGLSQQAVVVHRREDRALAASVVQRDDHPSPPAPYIPPHLLEFVQISNIYDEDLPTDAWLAAVDTEYDAAIETAHAKENRARAALARVREDLNAAIEEIKAAEDAKYAWRNGIVDSFREAGHDVGDYIDVGLPPPPNVGATNAPAPVTENMRTQWKRKDNEQVRRMLTDDEWLAVVRVRQNKRRDQQMERNRQGRL